MARRMPRSRGCTGMLAPFAYARRMDHRCLIAGCGYTGLRLARRLRPRWRVTALARSADAAARLAAEGIAHACAPTSMRPLPPGAARGRGRGRRCASPTSCRRPRPARAIRAWSASSPRSGAARPAVLLYMSTTGVYGDTGGATVTEATRRRARQRPLAAPRGGRGVARRLVRGARRALRRAARARHLRPGRLPLERLRARRARAAPGGRRARQPHPRRRPRERLRRGARAAGAAASSTSPTATPRAPRSSCSAPRHWPGCRRRRWSRSRTRPARISPGMLAFLRESRRVDNRRMREELGVEPRYARSRRRHRREPRRDAGSAGLRRGFGYPCRHAARLHEDAWTRQRLHRLRRAPARRRCPRPRRCAASPTGAPASASTRRWCSTPPRRAGTDVYYRIFNADGSEVEQCGNGARCIARLVASRAAARERTLVHGQPRRRSSNARLRADGLVSVAMGVPDFDPRSLPFDAEREAPSYRIELPSRPGRVRRGLDRQSARRDPRALGARRAGGHRRTRHGESRALSAPGERRASSRSWRPTTCGCACSSAASGETQACGTGACAAVAVGRRHGPLAEEVRVDVPGGRLIVQWPGPGEPIWLTGPAETAFEGHVDIPDAPGRPA